MPKRSEAPAGLVTTEEFAISPEQLMSLLSVAKAGPTNDQIIVGDEIEFHSGNHIGIPNNMPLMRALEIIKRVMKDQETKIQLPYTFKYRPNDGAVACATVMKRTFGVTFGETIHSMFGDTPPQTRSIPVSPCDSVEVPWGLVSIPSLPGSEIYIAAAHSEEDGALFSIQSTFPKKFTKVIKKFYQDIEEELRVNSIYRGKAVIGTDNPKFMDLKKFNANEIVFSEEVLDSLEGSLWYVLRHTNECKDEGIRCKRAILLHGDYGTGKSSAAYITAQIAEANGWGFIMANPGVDDINDVLKTARLYQPCVVFAEDIDNDANKVEQNEVSQLLESFDGLTSKSSEICLVMTTNHFETVHKGMLRPGRIDAVIEVGSLDRSGVETLVKAVVAPERLSEDIDYDQVYEAMVGFYPAFVREALERSKTYAIGRLAKEGNLVRGNIHYVLSTEDLVKAAHGLRPQLEALNVAKEGQKQPEIEGALRRLFKVEAQHAVHNAKLVDVDGDSYQHIEVPALKH